MRGDDYIKHDILYFILFRAEWHVMSFERSDQLQIFFFGSILNKKYSTEMKSSNENEINNQHIVCPTLRVYISLHYLASLDAIFQ